MARETYTRRQARNYDERNYIGDARALVKDLSELRKYELYEIVCTELRRSHTMKREKELEAVKGVLEDDRSLDPARLKKYRVGRSEMAEDARSRDGQTTVNRKKV